MSSIATGPSYRCAGSIFTSPSAPVRVRRKAGVSSAVAAFFCILLLPEIAVGQATLRLVAVDEPKRVSVSVPEGDSGRTNVRFLVKLADAGANQQVTVNYATSPGTGTNVATEGTDYRGATGKLTIRTDSSGNGSTRFTVQINGDTAPETDETFVVGLREIAGIGFITRSIKVIIGNDDFSQSLTYSAVPERLIIGETITAMTATADGLTGEVSYAVSVGNLPPGLVLNESTGAISGTPTTVNANSVTVVVTATAGTQSAGTSLTFPSVQLPAPKNIRVTEKDGELSVRWDAVSGAAGYQLAYRTASQDTFSSHFTTFTRTYEFTGLTNGERHIIRVWARKSGVNGVSGRIEGTPRAPPPPENQPPTLAEISEQKTVVGKSLEVTISASDGNGDSLSYRAMSSNEAIVTVSPKTRASYDSSPGARNHVRITPVAAGSTTVKVSVTDGTAEVSRDFSVVVLGVLPAPADLEVSSETLTGFTVQWTAVPSATGYVATAATAGESAVSGTVSGTMAEFTNLSAGTAYTISVHATGDSTSYTNRGAAATKSAMTERRLLNIGDASLTEGNSGTANMQFTVTMNWASSKPVTVAYRTLLTGNAGVGTDYTATSGTLTIAADSTSGTFNVPIVGDTIYEGNEIFGVVLSKPTGDATLGDATATGTITDDEAKPSLSIADASVGEGSGSGFVRMAFTVAMNPVSSRPVTVAYDTSPGTATAGTDYTTASGTLTIAAGSTSTTFFVKVLEDLVYEVDETFTVTLSSPTGDATLGDATATGTIINDEKEPALILADSSVSEGNSGTTNMRFTVTMAPVSSRPVTVNYATLADTDVSAATADTDYTTTSGSLTIAAGSTSATLDVPIRGDTVYEEHETFHVVLSNPIGADLRDGAATGRIINDDARPKLSIADTSVIEGSSGGATTMTFTVTMDRESIQQVTVDYSTADGTAKLREDYRTTRGTLTIAAGSTSATFDVPVRGDTVNEGDETFRVVLRNPSPSATLGDALATGTIIDDEDAPSLSIADSSVSEGNSGTTNMRFTVTMDKKSNRQVTVAYATSAGTATEGTDYEATSGTVTIAAGSTSGTFNVPVLGDTIDEPNEAFTVTLSNPTGIATLGDALATGTIIDDEDAPSLSIADSSVSEGNSGMTNMRFTVTMNRESSRQVTVNYETSSGTGTNAAIAGTDYTTTSSTLTIAAGSTSGTFNVPVLGDTIDESDETFTVTLKNPSSSAVLGNDKTATGTIIDDEDAPSLNIADSSVSEGNSGTTNMRFTVTMNRESSRQVTVNYETSSGTGTNAATAGTDYTATSDTLTIAAGSTSGTFNVPVLGDTIDESDETFTVTLKNPSSSAVLGSDKTATGTINDDDGLSLTYSSPPMSLTVDKAITVITATAKGFEGTVSYAVTLGTLPAGLTLDISTGTISGTPSTANANSVTVTVTATAGDQSASAKLTFPSVQSKERVHNSLPAPGNLQITEKDAKLAVSWDSVTGAKDYQLNYRLVGPDQEFLENPKVVSGTNYEIADLTNGMRYIIRVWARTAQDANGLPSIGEGTPRNPPPTIAAIEDQTAAVGRPLEVAIDAMDADDESLRYRAVSRDTEIATVSPLELTAYDKTPGASNVLTITPLKVGSVTIRAGVTDGTTYVIQEFTVSVHNSLPAPGNLQITEKDAKLAVSWDSVTGAKDYQLNYRLVGPDQEFLENPKVVSGTNYEIADLTNGMRYIIRVWARTAQDANGLPSIGEGTPRNPPPTIAAIEDQTAAVGRPLEVAIDAMDADDVPGNARIHHLHPLRQWLPPRVSRLPLSDPRWLR